MRDHRVSKGKALSPALGLCINRSPMVGDVQNPPGIFLSPNRYKSRYLNDTRGCHLITSDIQKAMNFKEDY